MKKWTLGIIIFFWIARSGFAGDIANFINLGFSDNTRYFIFAQYGIDEKNSTPYAELFVVDVPRNVFTANGKKEFKSTRRVEPGDNGMGALFALLEANCGLTKQYSIDPISRGRILYVLIDGEKAKDLLQFRDFNTENTYTITFTQKSSGSGKDIKSLFYIDAAISKAGAKDITMRIGSPDYQRAGVRGYRIRQILIAPDEKSLVFLIEKEETAAGSVNIRYMIETAKITG